MIEVLIKFFASLAEKLGEREVIISLENASNIQTLLNKLKQKYGTRFQETLFHPNGNIKDNYKILMNEGNVSEQNLIEIKLKNKDIIAFLPPIGGGY